MGVFVLAVILRGAWLILMYAEHDDADLLYLAPDCTRYVQIGTYLAGLPYEGPPPGWHSGPIYATPEGSILWSGPGYGLFLSALFAMFGTHALPVLIGQILLGSLNCALICVLARQLELTKRVALLAATLAAFSLTSISLSSMILTETLFFTLQLGGLLCLSAAFRRGLWSWFLLSAVLFGCAALVRGVTVFWPGVILFLAMTLPARSVTGARRRLLIKSAATAVLMACTILGWSARNFLRHEVFTFSEGGVMAARYFWTARTLASLDPNTNTRGMQHRMEAETLAKYGPNGTTFAQHHRDDLAVFSGALRDHPWPMAKRFIKSAYQNTTRGSELHEFQLPQFTAFWKLIKPVIDKKAGLVLTLLTIVGGFILLADSTHRGAGLILVTTYAYLCGITGFEFWQGSRICHPAQIAGAILVAVVLDRGYVLLSSLRRSAA